ncbi:inhibitor of Bruton tyrosine kinase, partial [Lecanoromycetidae sp. Uapishka_2]
MSTLLWKYYFDDNIDGFRQVLARASYNASAQTRAGKGGNTGHTSTGVAGSPGVTLSISPISSKNAKIVSNNTIPKLANVTLSRADINWRDSHGVTLLHHIASSSSEKASDFAMALLELPLLDLYIQDEESGWTALHRALYFGNISIARALMDRDIQDAYEHPIIGTSHVAGGLIKIKDREGNSPFDVYGASITRRNIRHGSDTPLLGGGPDDEDNDLAQGVSGDADDDDGSARAIAPSISIDGDQMFAFGSNKNFTLGFGDEDDRQFAERIHLKRPDHLLRRFYIEYEAQIRDVDVGQDGSIIICTDSGSVWRRVKRAKIKDATTVGLLENKSKDYKFSRVPGLTRITAVRSNTFGAYAAVRRDFDVLKTQVEVESHNLWKDLYPLLPFYGFGEEDSDTENPALRFWTSSQRDDIATIRRAVLTSSNLEQQVADFLSDQESSEKSSYNTRIGTTLSDVRIPVHDFMLGARSAILSRALATFRQTYFFTFPEVMNIEYDSDGKTLIIFQGADFITIFNIVMYIYTDSIVDVWHHTRHSPASAFRYRQVRTELMKIALQLDMQKLEQAVRIMGEPPKTLNKDFERAILQPGYFDDGDVRVNLNGESLKVHRALMIQRCPFFEGLFQGRAAGMWLSSRREHMREHQDTIDVDLKHVDPRIFQFVLRYLYSDVGEEIFDEITTTDVDSFHDLIMEVMSVANELMLDRLAQACQKMLGRFVDTRNVCQLLNAVAACSVTQFKDAALEYICLNLEGMLENHLLQELDEDLMHELDEVVRQNQLACLPIAKSGRAEADLVERYPKLVEKMEQSKRIRLDFISLQSRLHEREAKSAGGSKAKAALQDEFDQTPSAKKTRLRSPRVQGSHSKSPSMKAKQSSADLMFEMEEDGQSDTQESRKLTPNRRRRPSRSPNDDLLLPPSLPVDENAWGRQQLIAKADDDIAASTSPATHKCNEIFPTESTPLHTKKPWGPPTTGNPRLDMKDIMAQASPNRVSNLSAALSLRATEMDAFSPTTPAKVSQRERKKQQQKQLSQPPPPIPMSTPVFSEKQDDEKSSSSPWQVASKGAKISLKDVLGAGSSDSPPSQKGSVARTPSPLTLRQTVSGKAPSARRAVSGPATTVASTTKSSISTPDTSMVTARQTSPLSSRSFSTQYATEIQSVRHVAPPVEPSLQLSMADILSQQQLAKDVVKEAAAKRSLQEIQEEQAFQEWWDEESRKVKAEEEAKKPNARNGREARGKIRGR